MRRLATVAGARVVALAVWSGFFFWLWLSGEMRRYLGPRTYWVIGFGAITLVIATITYAVGSFPRVGERLTPRESTRLVWLLLPILAVVLVPNGGLGSLAADRKGVGARKEPAAGFPAYSRGNLFAEAVGIEEGRQVRVTGFVTGLKADAQRFDLTRFYISCCAADAIPLWVPVDSSTVGGTYAVDDWLTVAGELDRRDERLVLIATSIERTVEPDYPYIS